MFLNILVAKLSTQLPTSSHSNLGPFDAARAGRRKYGTLFGTRRTNLETQITKSSLLLSSCCRCFSVTARCHCSSSSLSPPPSSSSFLKISSFFASVVAVDCHRRCRRPCACCFVGFVALILILILLSIVLGVVCSSILSLLPC